MKKKYCRKLPLKRDKLKIEFSGTIEQPGGSNEKSPNGDRHKGGQNILLIFEWNVVTSRPDVKEEIQMETP